KQLNTWVSFQSAEQPLLGQFSVSGNNLSDFGAESANVLKGGDNLGGCEHGTSPSGCRAAVADSSLSPMPHKSQVLESGPQTDRVLPE
ncbi:hypothetical protein ACV4WX_30675, partial [Pseudomonas aeruginosa]